MSDALDKAVVEFNKFIETDLAYYDRGWEFLDAKIANIIALAKSEGKSEGLDEAAKACEALGCESVERKAMWDNACWACSEVIRAIDSLPSAVGGWMPIETAPLETVVWLLLEATVENKTRAGQRTVLPATRDDEGYWRYHGVLLDSPYWNRIGWQPLPTPPVNLEDL